MVSQVEKYFISNWILWRHIPVQAVGESGEPGVLDYYL